MLQTLLGKIMQSLSLILGHLLLNSTSPCGFAGCTRHISGPSQLRPGSPRPDRPVDHRARRNFAAYPHHARHDHQLRLPATRLPGHNSTGRLPRPHQPIGSTQQVGQNLEEDAGPAPTTTPRIRPSRTSGPCRRPPAPPARNLISPLLGNPQLYAQRMAGLAQPMTWGSAPPGQMAGTGFGPQQQPSVYGTSLMSNLQNLNNPAYMDLMAGSGGFYG